MKIRVLLVDDEKEYVETMRERLEARNLEVQTALSGNEALDRVRESDFDVVVLDLMMPGMNGIEAMVEMKRIRPLIEVILLTGYGSLDTAVKGMNLGAFYYLMKPPEMKNLLLHIAHAFKRKADQQERIRRAEVDRIVYSHTIGG